MAAAKRRLRGALASLSQSAEFGSFTKWVLLSALVGFVGGVAAYAFKGMIELTREWFFARPTGVTGEEAAGADWRLVLLIPTLGGLLVGWIIQKWAPEAEGHGTDSVVRSYHRLKGVVRQRVIYLKALTSALTIGSGGSAGQEGPVAQVGAGVGSSIATALKLSDRDRRLFLMSGATAGVGAMFCSPLGGALFMPEVLYRKAEFEGEAIIPCIISSIFAYATFTAISGEHRAVEIAPEVLTTLSFDDPTHLVVYLALGIACAFAGWLYTHVFYGIHSGFDRLNVLPKHLRPALGGFLMGVVALGVGPLAAGGGVFFGGYGLMQASIAGTLTIGALLALILAKILATSFTISSGGSGGVFAPALAIGAMVGALIGKGADALIPALEINPACFALVGMGGFFAGVAKAPIASVIMVSEMTGSYSLLAPLMLVAVVHMMLSTRWTLYRAQVPGPIDSPAHVGDFVVDVLQGIKVSDVLGEARPPRLIHEDVTLKGAMRIVADSHETHFPVVADGDQLVGIFSLTDLRRIFLMDVVEDMVIVRDFMHDKVTTVTMSDSLHEVQRLMTRRGVSAVPVVDEENPRKVLALLERNVVGRAYGDKLAAMKEGG
ncbi:MAG: chloride channel protein [bacterium]|nr:chloride channel protein [bacterium]